MGISIKSKQQIEYMRQAGKIVAESLVIAREVIKPGISTQEINDALERHILKRGATPSFKGYNGFPAAVCTSINNEVVHGIPGLKVLKEGDIISIDVGACINGYHGDAAETFEVGNVTDIAKKLIEVTRQSFYEGIKFATSNNRLQDISSAIQKYVESYGFSAVRKYVGHGIGQNVHEDPQVPNYGKPGHGPRLATGMTLAIEPMINAGGFDVTTLANQWTVVTADGSLSAHYENTILITDDQPEILTMV